MPKTIQDEPTINAYTHYAKALMLHRRVTVKSRDPHGVLEATRPNFTGEHGGKMRISTNGVREYITLRSTEEGVEKVVKLPLRASNIDNYTRRLCAVNTSSRVDDTNPIGWEVKAFYRYVKTGRPKSFSVTDDQDRGSSKSPIMLQPLRAALLVTQRRVKSFFRQCLKLGCYPKIMMSLSAL